MKSLLSQKFLEKIDAFSRNFFIKNADKMPMRFVKMLAFYYADAVVRKIYLKRLGFVLGENSFTNLGLQFTPNDDFSPSVIVGANVSIGPNVTFIPNSAPNNSPTLLANSYVAQNLAKEKNTIFVEDDVWIGSGAVILSGVRLRKGSIIGAGAVVTKNTDKFSIYAGVPAKKIREI